MAPLIPVKSPTATLLQMMTERLVISKFADLFFIIQHTYSALSALSRTDPESAERDSDEDRGSISTHKGCVKAPFLTGNIRYSSALFLADPITAQEHH